MFAVIKTGGKQYRVAAQDVLQVGRLEAKPGAVVEFGEVLVVGGEAAGGGVPTIVAPPPAAATPAASTIAGASVATEVLDHVRGETPPQEFAPQPRPSPAILAGAHH